MVAPTPDAQWRVSYDYYSNTNQLYLDTGYYSTSATDWLESNTTLLNGGVDHTTIDLELILGKKISGTVSLPPGASPLPDDTSFEVLVQAIDTDNVTVYRQYSYIVLASGETSVAYTSIAPPRADVIAGYERFFVSGYFQTGYYNSPGTTWIKEGAQVLSGIADHTGIDMTVLRSKKVSGTITLPPGEVAADLIDVYLYFSQPGSTSAPINDNSYYNYIDEGDNSATYIFNVPADDVIVGFHGYWQYITPLPPYLTKVWYASSGTQWDRTRATLLTGSSDHTDIDMDVLIGRPISGTFSKPSEFNGTIIYFINASNMAGAPYDTSLVRYLSPEGTSTAYTLYVPNDTSTSWQVSYYQSYKKTYPQSGYYNTSETTCRERLATLLPGGVDHTNIDLTMLLILCPQESPWNLFMSAILSSRQ